MRHGSRVFGGDWTGIGASVAAEEFEGLNSIAADFGGNTLTGCADRLGDIRISRERPYAVPGREVEEPLALPNDCELHFGRMKIGPDGKDWASRYVLARRLSNPLDASFCTDALEEAPLRPGPTTRSRRQHYAASVSAPGCLPANAWRTSSMA